jgi:hypothetical protein
MIRVDHVGDDPERLKLCIARAHELAPGKPVPFEIDSKWAARARQEHPDEIIIAVDNGTPWLVTCAVNSGSGKYGPLSASGETAWWHTIKPPRDLDTRKAVAVCTKAAPEKINRPGLYNSSAFMPVEISSLPEANCATAGKFYTGMVIGGKTAKRYDVAVEGMATYKSSTPDMDKVDYTCLFSPMLELKAIQLAHMPVNCMAGKRPVRQR